MTELLFKRGTQEALDKITSSIDGCFYLTEDTNRLYMGRKGKAPALLNQTVSVVNSVSDLPGSPPAADNDFYYIKSLNVLAVYDSSKKSDTNSGWVQINANTNDTIEVDNINFAVNEEKSTEGKIVYTLTLSQKKYDINGAEIQNEHPNDLTAELTLNSSDIANIVPEAATVGLIAQNVRDGGVDGVKIMTDGDGSDPNTFISIMPGKNVDNITVDDNGKIIIAAHNNTYEATVDVDENNNVYLQLLDNVDDDHSKVKFAAGNDIVITGNETDDVITIAHEAFTAASVNISNIKNNVDNLSAGSEFTTISGITLDNGHITKIDTETVKLPTDTHFTETIHEENSWVTTFKDNNDTPWTVDFSADAATMEEELKSYIDQGLAAANTALTYKGKISKYSDLDDLTDVEVGDVYLLDTSIDPYKVGDLFIATSKTNKAGVLAEDDLLWTYIPSGNELIIDTHFKGVASITGKTGITDNENNGSAKFQVNAVVNADGDDNTPDSNETLQLIAGQGLEIVNNTQSLSKDKVATIRHETVAVETPGSAVENDTFVVDAITGITLNNGHITKIDTKKYNIATYKLQGENDKITLIDTAENSTDIEISGDNWIDTSVSDDKITISHNAANTASSKIEVDNGDKNGKLSADGALNIISGVHYDAAGHIVEVKTAALTLPDDTTYKYYVGNGQQELADAVTVSNPSLVLFDSNENVEKIQLASSNENIAITGQKEKITFNMVWGSFN